MRSLRWGASERWGDGLAVCLLGETRDVARGVGIDRQNAVSKLGQDGGD
jgi:hypothetical protein